MVANNIKAGEIESIEIKEFVVNLDFKDMSKMDFYLSSNSKILRRFVSALQLLVTLPFYIARVRLINFGDLI